jgi:hypothetical protein
MPFWSRSSPEPEYESEARVETLSPTQVDWIARNVSAVREFLPQIGVDPSADLSARSLDALWNHLLADEHDPQVAINMVGIGLGQMLVDRFRLEWAELPGDHGTEIALRGPYSLTVFPTQYVAECHARGERNFVEPFVYDVARQISDT